MVVCQLKALPADFTPSPSATGQGRNAVESLCDSVWLNDEVQPPDRRLVFVFFFLSFFFFFFLIVSPQADSQNGEEGRQRQRVACRSVQKTDR